MTDFSADKLRELIAKATDEDLTDDGRYFDETFNDLTKCGHGDTGEYQNRHDGKLVELLWNKRAAILAMAEREKRMREALEEIAKHNTLGTPTAEANIARRALAEEKA